MCCPHFNHRREDFLSALNCIDFDKAYAIEDDSALVFVNSKLTQSLTSGGKSYLITKENDSFEIQEI